MIINCKKCKKGTTLVEMLVALAVFAIASIFLITIFVTAIMINKKTLDNMINNSLFRMVNEYATSKLKEDTPKINEKDGDEIEIDPEDPTTFEDKNLSVKSDALKHYMNETQYPQNKDLEYLNYDNYYFKIKSLGNNSEDTSDPTRVEGHIIYNYLIQLYHKDNTTGEFELVRSIQTRVHKEEK